MESSGDTLEVAITGEGISPATVPIKALALVLGRLLSLRTEPLDARAADIAAMMRRSVLKQREGRERGTVTYDTLIAAIAHRIGARWLLTANPKDMRKCLAVVNSKVEVVDTTGIPEKGQLDLQAHQRRGGSNA